MIASLLAPTSLACVKKPPQNLFFIGNTALLEKRKISIVGTRSPSQYTREMTRQIAQKLASLDIVVVSGAAMGVDALAHQGAMPHTIAVMANSLDIRYPAVNKKLITQVESEALVLSEYETPYRATRYSFVLRNRIVVALGEVLIITQADENSGTMRSAQIAQELGKKIYVLSHRVGESLGTQKLLEEGKAELITDIDLFIAQFGDLQGSGGDVLDFFKTPKTLAASLEQFGERIYMWELEGKLTIKNLRVTLS